MTKFLDPKFSSRPSSQAYRDNFEATFQTREPEPDNIPAPDDIPAPEGQVYVCAACGRTATTRNGFRKYPCSRQAVLCFDREANQREWKAVEK